MSEHRRSKRATPFTALVTMARTGALVGAIIAAGALADPAQAATVTIADGSLAGSVNAQNAEGVFTSLTSDFNIANGPLTFSGTLDPTSAGNGDYNFGMTVGTVYFLIHPGFGGGAFRYDPFDVNNGNRVSPFALTPNQSIGYTPDASATDFEIVLTDAGSGNFNVSVDITQGANASSISDFLLAASLFGTGGDVSSFGVMHNGIPVSGSSNGRGPLAYANVTAMTAVPLPATLPLFVFALAGFGYVARRRSA